MAAAWTECTKNCCFFLAWWNPGAIRGFAVFTGGFLKKWCAADGFLCTKCGETDGKRWFPECSFSEGENFANFSSLFSGGGIYTFVTIQLDQKALDWRA
jgi:hypothetical protein